MDTVDLDLMDELAIGTQSGLYESLSLSLSFFYIWSDAELANYTLHPLITSKATLTILQMYDLARYNGVPILSRDTYHYMDNHVGWGIRELNSLMGVPPSTWAAISAYKTQSAYAARQCSQSPRITLISTRGDAPWRIPWTSVNCCRLLPHFVN
jgi:hypothetical protein